MQAQYLPIRATGLADDVSLKKTFAVSLLLHLLLLLVPIGVIVQDRAEALAEEVKKELDKMTFIFVETPENAAESPVDQLTPFISDKNLAASNPQAPDELTEGMPYQEGRSEVAAMTPEPSPPARAPEGATASAQTESRERNEQLREAD